MNEVSSGASSWFDVTFMGHGHCYLWRPDLVALHVISDVLIAIAYFTIPLALYVLMHKRKDLEFSWMFVLFALFIFSCGLTHLMSVYNVWSGAYYASGALKAVTAIVSLLTAALIWPLIPKAMALPRPAQLQAANESLQSEITLRRESEENLKSARLDLQNRVTELEQARDRLEKEIERRQLLEARERAHSEALKRSNEDLVQFAFIASHDLREPLRKLSAFTQMLMTGKYGEFNEKGQQFVQYIREAAERMDELLSSLLNYSRVSSRWEEEENVAMDRVVDDACRDLQLRIEECDATIEISRPLCEVHGDRAQIRQLMQNLISNSLKYRVEGTKPVIRISCEPDPEAGRCRVNVTDNGIGFDMAYSEQIFEVFKRLHGRGEYEGTGMGLAICKKIVERHGGRLTAESADGEGATFKFDLPLSGGRVLTA